MSVDQRGMSINSRAKVLGLISGAPHWPPLLTEWIYSSCLVLDLHLQFVMSRHNRVNVVKNHFISHWRPRTVVNATLQVPIVVNYYIDCKGTTIVKCYNDKAYRRALFNSGSVSRHTRFMRSAWASDRTVILHGNGSTLDGKKKFVRPSTLNLPSYD
jgi:hypothetical protein